jgi:hypothetical protein
MVMPKRKGEKEMCELKGKYALLLVCIAFPLFNSETSTRSLTNERRARLYDSVKRRGGAPLTIDVSYTTKTVTEPEAAKKGEEARMERTKILRKESNSDSITLVGVGIALPDGSDIRLSETRIRIGTGLTLRKDTTIFANTEKTETHYKATTINTGFVKDSPSYEIDHKLKRVSIRTGRRFSGREVLRLGQVDEFIVMDVARYCNPSQRLNAKAPKKKEFVHSATGTLDGKGVDEIDCIDIEKGTVEYRLSLDPNDWQICRKIVRFDSESGLASNSIEYKEFAKAQGTGELFPRLIVRRYFDKKGKEEKVETINVTNVVIGLSVPEDIFKLDAPPDYTIIDNR